MDLNFTPEELTFREEARRFFRTQIPESIRAKVAEGEGLTKQDMVTAQRILNQHGWCTVNWPVEWGGKDWSPVQVYLYQDEMQQANCPAPSCSRTSFGRCGRSSACVTKSGASSGSRPVACRSSRSTRREPTKSARHGRSRH